MCPNLEVMSQLVTTYIVSGNGVKTQMSLIEILKWKSTPSSYSKTIGEKYFNSCRRK